MCLAAIYSLSSVTFAPIASCWSFVPCFWKMSVVYSKKRSSVTFVPTDCTDWRRKAGYVVGLHRRDPVAHGVDAVVVGADLDDEGSSLFIEVRVLVEKRGSIELAVVVVVASLGRVQRLAA